MPPNASMQYNNINGNTKTRHSEIALKYLKLFIEMQTYWEDMQNSMLSSNLGRTSPTALILEFLYRIIGDVHNFEIEIKHCPLDKAG